MGENKNLFFAYRTTHHGVSYETDITEMPGLGKEDVKLSFETNITKIPGLRKEDVKPSMEPNWVTIKYGEQSFTLAERWDKLKTDEIKVEIKNKVLKVVIPYKVKKQKRTFETILNKCTEEAWYLELDMGRADVTYDDMDLTVNANPNTIFLCTTLLVVEEEEEEEEGEEEERKKRRRRIDCVSCS